MLEGEEQHGIAREDGRRLAKGFVGGGSPTAEVIVIHVGEVVVHEGHGVDHLRRAGGGHGGALISADELAGGDAKEGPDSLAAGEERVPHGLVEGLRRPEGDGRFQRPVDGIALLPHVGPEIEGRGSLVILLTPLPTSPFYYVCFRGKDRDL